MADIRSYFIEEYGIDSSCPIYFQTFFFKEIPNFDKILGVLDERAAAAAK